MNNPSAEHNLRDEEFWARFEKATRSNQHASSIIMTMRAMPQTPTPVESDIFIRAVITEFACLRAALITETLEEIITILAKGDHPPDRTGKLLATTYLKSREKYDEQSTKLTNSLTALEVVIEDLMKKEKDGH